MSENSTSVTPGNPFSEYATEDHLGISISIACLNALAVAANVMGFVYFLVKQRHLLKKKVYQMFLGSLIVDALANSAVLLRFYTPFVTHVAGILIFVNVLIFFLVSQIYLVWHQFWTVLDLFSVLSPFVERILFPYYCVFTSLTAIVQISTLIFAFFELSADLLILPTIVNAHLSIFLVFTSFAVGSVVYLASHSHRMITRFHTKEKKFNDGASLAALKSRIIFCIAILVFQCCLIPILFFKFTLLFEMFAIQSFCMALLPSIHINLFRLAIKISLPKKPQSIENKSKPLLLVDLIKMKKTPNGDQQVSKHIFSIATVKIDRSELPTIPSKLTSEKTATDRRF